MIDDLDATTRTLDTGGERQVLLLRREYDAGIEDVWDALTDPDRMARFFMRPTGELREGGSFAFEGNAGGDILRCEPPRRFRVTWVYGEPRELPPDEVEVRLSQHSAERTVLELEHSSSGPLTDSLLNRDGLWGLGAGWELGILALASYLAGSFPGTDPARLGERPEITALADRISAAWAVVLEEQRTR